ncbi:hypothetical protein HDU85_002603 [Gaertneriomyces sp. JEL0708]|nr:hypothetical protein HDU85_002603 [Gaertneriomyces sp. JEL0708]
MDLVGFDVPGYGDTLRRPNLASTIPIFSPAEKANPSPDDPKQPDTLEIPPWTCDGQLVLEGYATSEDAVNACMEYANRQRFSLTKTASKKRYDKNLFQRVYLGCTHYGTPRNTRNLQDHQRKKFRASAKLGCCYKMTVFYHRPTDTYRIGFCDRTHTNHLPSLRKRRSDKALPSDSQDFLNHADRCSFYSALQLVAAVRRHQHARKVHELGSERLKLLNSLAFVLAPDPQNPIAVSFDLNTGEALVARNIYVDASPAHLGNVQFLLKLFFALEATAAHRQHRMMIYNQFLRSTIEFCWNRLSKRMRTLKTALAEWNATSPLIVGDKLSYLPKIHQLVDEAPTTRVPATNVDRMVEVVKNVHGFLQSLETSEVNNVDADLILGPLRKASQYVAEIKNILGCLDTIRNRLPADPERCFFENFRFHEMSSSPTVVIGDLSVEAATKVLGIDKYRHELVVRMGDESHTGPFLSKLPIVKHAEIVLCEEMRKRGNNGGDIGVSSLCCLLCWETLKALGWRTGGCSGKIQDKWQLATTGENILGRLITLFRESIMADIEKLGVRSSDGASRILDFEDQDEMNWTRSA